jgi:antitoxin (DNA-binding transcriptional repressor) of toxin-antitoxin stability system
MAAWVAEAQQERVVLTREGKPVAVVTGLDEEQRRLGSSDELWKLIAERRRQPAISRAELERRLATRERSSGSHEGS